jgi:hypothetical protein
MAQTGTGQIGYRVLGIYLNDHLAGATAGTELAHRAARTHRAPGQGGQLKRLAAEVAQDRAALIAMMQALGIPVRAYKVCRLGRGESRAGETQRPAAHPVTPQRPRGAGTAPARRRRQGSRLAYPADAGGHRQAAGPRTPRRAHVPGAAPSRPARRTPGPSRGAGHQLLTAGRHRRNPSHTRDHPRPRTRRQAVRARRRRVRPRPLRIPGVEGRRLGPPVKDETPEQWAQRALLLLRSGLAPRPAGRR